ncbi:MAG: hypothetical protein WCD18_03090, partial [Thermosynechococcaceae cyanobacterium]
MGLTTQPFKVAQWVAIALGLTVPLLLACVKPSADKQVTAHATALPPTVQTELLDRMAQTSFISRDQLRIGQLTRATWKDCLHPSADQLLEPSCQAVDRTGWR